MASFIFTFLAIVVALAAGGAGGYMYRKNVQEKKIGRNEEFARNLLDEAQKRAEEKKKEWQEYQTAVSGVLSLQRGC